ncbi:MAG: hypothetical protein ACJAW7_003103 [Candidatus Azotimanducaceae bacterium]
MLLFGVGITPLLKEYINTFTILVYCAPKRLQLPTDLHDTSAMKQVSPYP